mmetsp:Transcript_16025/g.38279  ORF Transcript_16025/g.38279 Transcript_16025/m.38279 type:complete len:419 (-) Transcript_16025:66-1322(-)|eukprot:CAMPEP_0185808062 /NCGR_PEP_ID=MMETSP1322-20130828/5387_1 /TAXON_ID=265543 /ORGANISM="Minutocellus polymorphus, Strain RCC2270" /LENGTH=418 /DNA_ID=CAMNT_0028504259 /DNA_START=32 /DNA_END=1288 /DNA_ORIENTATION=-
MPSSSTFAPHAAPPTACCNSLHAASALTVVAALALIATIAVPSNNMPSVALLTMLPLIMLFSGVAIFKDKRTDEMIRKHNAAAMDDDVEGGGGSYVDMASAAKSQATYLPELADFMHRIDLGLRPSRFSAVLINGSGAALMILLVFRLTFGANHFKGNAITLDFGPKYGNPSNDAEQNIAFTLEFNSFGHCLQGILASLLVSPAVTGTLTRLVASGGSEWSGRLIFATPSTWMIVLVELLAGLMTIYPSYNFIKRLLEYPESFASTSFMNNGFEWGLGFLFGISLGCLVTAFTRTKFRRQFPSISRHSSKAKKIRFREDDYERPLAYGLYSDHKDDMSPSVYWTATIIRAVLAVMLVFSVIGAAVMTGETWNSCRGDLAGQCVNYSQDALDPVIEYGFIAVPVVTYLVAIIISRDFSN